MANLKGFDNIRVEADDKTIDDILKEKGLLQYKLVQVISRDVSVGFIKSIQKYWLFFTRETELEIVNTCKFCVHFDEIQYFCGFHKDSTAPDDSCKDWSSIESVEQLVEIKDESLL